MNLPVSQFYHVSVDDAIPYHVYGGLRDKQLLGGRFILPWRRDKFAMGKHVLRRRFLDVA
jgi:hypothetical protein